MLLAAGFCGNVPGFLVGVPAVSCGHTGFSAHRKPQEVGGIGSRVITEALYYGTYGTPNLYAPNFATVVFSVWQVTAAA